MTSYQSRSRKITETVQIGSQVVEVEASWYWISDDERVQVHVVIGNQAANGRTIRLTDVGEDGVLELAQVLLTVERMLRAEAVMADVE